MDFKIEEIKKENKKIYNYDISKLIKKDTVDFNEARFVLETLCHEVSQEKFDFFVLLIKYRKYNIKKYTVEKNNNFFRIKSNFKVTKNKQVIGAYIYYNKEVFILGKTISLSTMLRELFLKLRYINQERRIKFITENPELSKNNEQIYLIYKEKKDFFEANIDAHEVSLKQMIGICERFDLNNKLLKDMQKELVIVQNRRKKKEYETVKSKIDNIIEYIDLGEIWDLKEYM